MRVLLDTHALLWAVLAPGSLSRRGAAIVADEKNQILVSAASAWEIATKVRLGKLPGAEVLEREFLAVMEEAGYTLLPIEAAAALRAGRLVAEHRDPFDRVLAAQALEEDMPILSADAQLDAFGVRRLW
ncbi:MAG: type II toxin-antitoxin system VapC family toxin [Acidobacteriaceae bacterium]